MCSYFGSALCMREVMFILARDRKFLDKSRLLTRDCQRRKILVKISWLLTNFLPRVFYLLKATPDPLNTDTSVILLTVSYPWGKPGESLTFPHGPTDTWLHSNLENLIESYPYYTYTSLSTVCCNKRYQFF